ncbi:ABC transporter substrate-binding protein [Microbispora sp. NBRC 16548]|uniref:ABC transporter substrate-binding protein n=1 Tax=Microbispora sp. NBRC 16548 TaxID=3030994 RepID=UPI0024A0DDE0|nr:ABC transporter substrate-binding protein [Microbispora sp. NBRC 16548]GLX10990.1 ABC transporter substrate-binding protein [Microbispora sp. NBRC 16548]
MKRTLTVAAAVLAAALSTACQSPAAGNPGTAGAAGQGRGGTLVVGMTSSDLPNLDTVLNGQGFEGTRFVGFQLFEGLTHYDLTRDDRVPPVTGALATSWTHSADGRTWTFELRQGVRFHDGTPFDADGVIFNLDRYTKKGDPYATPALQSAASEYTGTFASYRKVDERHVEIVTKEPNGHLPDDLTHVYIASPAAVKHGDFGAHPVGTGPFRFGSLTPGQRLELLPNTSYWGPVSKLGKLVLRPIPDPAARVAALRAGEVNWIEYPTPDDVTALKDTGFQVPTNGYDHIWYWILDTAKKPWSDVRVRRAANYAINREALATGLLRGTADPAYQAAPRATAAYDPKGDVYSYDPAKAKSLLAEAGVAGGFETTVVVPTGGSGNLTPVPIAESLQRDLAAVGIKVNIKTIEWSALLSQEAAGKVPYGADAIAQSTTLFQSEALLPLFLGSGSPFWTGHYANKRVDELFIKAAQSPDVAGRAATYRQALDLVTQDAPWLFVVNDRNPRAIAPAVHGLVQPKSWFLDLTSVWVSGA